MLSRACALAVLAIVATVPAMRVSAGIVPLEDHRYVKAQDYHYGTVQSFPFFPFADFNGRAEGVEGAATQASFIAKTSMGGQSFYETYGGNGTQHDSTYEIVFQVDKPSSYAFSGSLYSGWGGSLDPADGPDDVKAALMMRGSAELFSASVSRDKPRVDFGDLGELAPGETYTLSVWFRAPPPGRMFHTASWHFAFAVVPEPATLTVLALGLVALSWSRRPRHC